ncbi:MAG: hypothetical protein AAGA28_10275 [Pseudomonadota bacterium]
MHTDDSDRLNRTGVPPLWFDEAAVPRFEPFAPRLVANNHAQDAVLARIE